MPRIIGIDIPKGKRIEVALTYIYGISRSLSNKILAMAAINPDARAKDLTEEEIARLTNLLQKEAKVEGDLRREVAQNIKRLIDIGSWRGMRHKRGLPTRGQRTKTNARTRKGPRRTVGAIKAKVKESAEKENKT